MSKNYKPQVKDKETEEVVVAEVRETKSVVIDKAYHGGMLTGLAIIDAVKSGEIEISDFDTKRINPNSYNVRLNNILKIYIDPVLDCRKHNETKTIVIPEEGFILQPNELYIGSTMEYIHTDEYIPQIDGRSSSGRLGINIHATAGFGDIGFRGTFTLEITVPKPVLVVPGMEIAQIAFMTPYGDKSIKYDGRYQGQIEPTESKFEETKKVYL